MRQQEQIEREVGPHRAGRRAMLVDVVEIARQPAVLRTLIERARRTCHRRHDGEEQREDHQDHEELRDDLAAAHHVAKRFADAGAIDDAGCQHAGVAEHALEGEGDEEEEQAAQKAGIEDRLEGVGLRVLEFAGVADGRFEAVGRPGRDEQAARGTASSRHCSRCRRRRNRQRSAARDP